MGRFYFHIRMSDTDQMISDHEGSDLSDIASARLEALAAARCILADAIRSGNENIPDAFVIVDDQGRELDTVPLSVVLPQRFK
jgi:hypothetical protein